jgi:hypothetical protein
LSDAWFDELADAADGPAPEGGDRQAPDWPEPGLVIEVIASGAPEGEVRYQIMVDGQSPRVVSRKAEFRPAQVELRADYATLAAIASGRQSAIEALSSGLARVSGNISALSANQSRLSALELLPQVVRAGTTF